MMLTEIPNTCLLNGEERPRIYEACSQKSDAYDTDVFKYIGKGYIHSVRGQKYRSPEEYHFWVYKRESEFLIKEAEKFVETLKVHPNSDAALIKALYEFAVIIFNRG